MSSDLIEIVTIVHQKRKNIKRILLNMKNAVIFGASSTIAVKLADILAQNGYNLVLLARNVEYLQLDAQNLRVKHQNVVINTLYYDASVDTNMPDLIEKIKQSINSIAIVKYLIILSFLLFLSYLGGIKSIIFISTLRDILY